MTWKDQAEEFLKVSDQFQLGHLPTEQPHPLTMNLSELAKANLPEAIDLLLKVEHQAANTLLGKIEAINEMRDSVHQTLLSGGRIFLCGCGATGRLSLSLETFWRELVTNSDREENWSDKVFSFMAGGDYALVHSIENFEDFPDYGARQLKDLGFRDGDLLISTTEGGETPFVIGATLEAARISKIKPYFLYCNPDHILTEKLERCRQVIFNEQIKKIALEIGPMAICGSTRLQASTVLMLAVGAALLNPITKTPPEDEIKDFLIRLNTKDFLGLEPLIVAESKYYAHNVQLMHAATDYAITLLTDLTERSPTFSLSGFVNYNFSQDQAPSWTYLWVPSAKNSLASWQTILKRSPRCLEWTNFSEKYGQSAALGFDFSDTGKFQRAERYKEGELRVFTINRLQGESKIEYKHDEIVHHMLRPKSLLVEHLVVKIALNISSNLVMSRLDRVFGNMMLWVRASNNKLVDRAIRYVQILFKNAGEAKRFSYEQIAFELFKTREHIVGNQPVVLQTYENLKKM